MDKIMSACEGISVEIPEKVFFSMDPAAYIVKNDFYFTIFKTVSEKNESSKNQRRGGEIYPTIYIKGFEQLFEEAQLYHFFKMFHSNGNKDWSIEYGRFRDTEEYCAVITGPDQLEPDFIVGFQLSDKCAFTKVPDTASPVELQVYIDDFDCAFSDLPDRIHYNIRLERGFAVYIEKFGAYTDSEPNTPVAAVHKGDSVNISWKIENSEKASAFLYDENGSVVANLPPYTALVDRDRKFTLTAYNDFCSVTQSLVVYRTLWSKNDAAPEGFPKADEKGRFRFYRSYGGTYYLYAHPYLYFSQDLKEWEIFSTNTVPPSDYNYYSASFSEGKFGVCYLSDTMLTYCEMSFYDKSWLRYDIERSGLLSAHVMFSEKTMMALAAADGVGLYDFVGGTLMNGRYLETSKGTAVVAMDALSEGENSCLAVLYDNDRVYFYDLRDDYKNNIFECPDVAGDNIYLIKSNAIYIMLNGYMFEVSDRDKFSDLHFFPEYKEGTHPVVGAADNETIIGVFQTQQGTDAWEYKF